MATHSSVLAWRIPGAGEPPMAVKAESPNHSSAREVPLLYFYLAFLKINFPLFFIF